jgi:hypothetical protein
VLLFFWATSNRMALWQLSRLEQWIQRRGRPIEVMSVHTPLEVTDMDQGRVMSAIRECGLHHVVALDDEDGALADAYDVRDLPAYFHFDAQLRLRNRKEGNGAVAAMDRLLASAGL